MWCHSRRPSRHRHLRVLCCRSRSAAECLMWLFCLAVEQSTVERMNAIFAYLLLSSRLLSFPFLLYSTCILFTLQYSVSMRPSCFNNSIFYNISQYVLREIIMFSVYFLWRLFPYVHFLCFHNERISHVGSCQSERLDESCTRGGKTCGRFSLFVCGISL